jgi:murein DD-endopeptidase MepM/ murein hydrolase activator NlpD
VPAGWLKKAEEKMNAIVFINYFLNIQTCLYKRVAYYICHMKVSIILHKIIIIFTSGLFSVTSVLMQSTEAQIFSPKNTQTNYFSWPLQAKVGIAANFGELRPNHYHMGLDCRTDKKQNMPVLAAAAGYIAKVKIEPFGFGRAIYINHPNGLTTLYAQPE